MSTSKNENPPNIPSLSKGGAERLVLDILK
jgi:hypothetical protein